MALGYRTVFVFLFILLIALLPAPPAAAQAAVEARFISLKKKDSVPLLACGSDRWLARMRSNPAFVQREQQMNQAILSTSGTLGDNSYVLPVVFHIISANPFSVTDLQIQNALQDLNNAFSKSGPYSGSAGADTKIQFCLAKTDPQGGSSTGITRTVSFYSDMDQDIEDARMKQLADWDPIHYINIWYVTGIESEILSKFSCGAWTRNKEAGYATMPPGGDSTDGIVISAFGHLLAHEMGHYLGLYHTFEGLNCANNNCALDGDRVCDTPPDASIYNSVSCSQPDNTCHSDTLSGFTTDVPDLIADFMDYGNDECHNEFTEGQAVRMRAAIITQRSGLLQNKCTPACAENSIASFTRNNAYPLPSDLVSFSNTSTGASSFQWLINGMPVSTAPNYSHVFAATGKFAVTLKAFNSNANCYSSYTDNVFVNCGVTARFYPNKRVIASKTPIFPDSIYFTNRSVNATAYKWLMSNDAGMAPQIVSTATDLNYTFANPANYSLRLIASNGTCTDTSDAFNFAVLDPTADAVVFISSVYCYQQTKIAVNFTVCNYGYAAVLPKTPISFYDDDPRSGKAHRLGDVFLLPDSVKGNCCGNQYQAILNIGRPGLNKLFVVVNDNGSSSPFQLPNTAFPETDYLNNFSSDTGFQFHASINPPQISGLPGDNVQLNGEGGPDNIQSILWTPPSGLSCTECLSPVLVLDSSGTKKLLLESVNQCFDSAFAVIKVGIGDDFSINLSNVSCSKNDSVDLHFSLCNQFRLGIIPKGLAVSFYNGNPSTDTAHLLAPVFKTSKDFPGTCTGFDQNIALSESASIYAVVNDSALSAAVTLPGPNSLPENNYANNVSAFNYVAPSLLLTTSDTTVERNKPFPITVVNSDGGTANWTAGAGYSLSCTSCSTALIVAQSNAIIPVQYNSVGGCVLTGDAKIHILAPDLTVQLLDNICFTGNSTLVRFNICINNGYDSIPANLPVAFYDADPASGNAHLLEPVFFTADSISGTCVSFNHVIQTATTGTIYAEVNDNGSGGQLPAEPAFVETDYSNNKDHEALKHFIISVSPADTSISRGSPLMLSASLQDTSHAHYRWEPVDFLSCNNCLDPVSVPANSINYTFIAQNQYSCIDTAYASIKTFTGGTVNIPNGFTPNGDGLNDVFYILGGQDVRSVVGFSVFSRWGERVFEASHTAANDPAKGWNGNFRGKPAETGTYVYLVSIEFTDGHTQQYKGTVTLIR